MELSGVRRKRKMPRQGTMLDSAESGKKKSRAYVVANAKPMS
jgi:hypothetical protein